ncbi:3-hydroxyacyl-CoA dehydrogenase NAD-binding domain-containing protein [Thalassiella azotivora]
MTTQTDTPDVVRYERDADGVVVLTLDDPRSSANTMNEAYRRSMGAAVDRLEAERDDVRGVVVTSAKSTFFAGGDLHLLQSVQPEQAGEFFARIEEVKAQLRRLERLGRPVVAALNGTALGGGLEIALACHRRVAVDDPSLRLGVPEVTLGLLPGGGGVTRLVRMLGLQPALTGWLLEGRRHTARAAAEAGVVDELVATAEDLLPAARRWVLEHADDPGAATQPWDRKGYRLPGGTPSSPGLAAVLPAFPATLRTTLKGHPAPAPRAILCAAVEGAQVDVDTALRIESRYLTSLVTRPVAKAMIQAFFHDLQAIGSGRTRPAGVVHGTARRVGVVGAGMMGAGIAHACASSGIDVVLVDVDVEAARRGRDHAAAVLDRRVAKGRMTDADRDAVLARITPTAATADLAGCDVVVEAVFEDAELKHRVLADVEAVVGPDCLITSNTSTLPISGLATAVQRQTDVVGLHFFSPVDRMRLVEIVRGERSSDEAVARAVDLVQQIGKVPVVVGDGRGFFTSRVFGTLVMEAAALVGEGVDPMTVERAATAAGFPAPPLAMLDEVSLTLTQHIRAEARKAAETEGTPYAEHPGAAVVDRMVELGRAGRAAGGGFYDYPDDGPKRLWPGVREHFTRPEVQVPYADVQDRYRFAMALETAGCLADGVLRDTATANVGAILGIGYPPTTGGPAQYMTGYDGGLAGFVARADGLADAYGERFRPSAWLRERAVAGSLV